MFADDTKLFRSIHTDNDCRGILMLYVDGHLSGSCFLISLNVHCYLLGIHLILIMIQWIPLILKVLDIQRIWVLLLIII